MCMGSRPTRQWLFFLEPILLIIALVLQTFVSVSLPIFKPVDLFALHLTDNGTVANQGEIRFGLWGFCFLDEYNLEDGTFGTCSSPQVGYTLSPAIPSALGLSTSLYDIVTEVFTGFLIIHPIIAGLTLITLVPEVFLYSRRARITSLVFNIISAILSTLVTAIDLAIIIVARSKLQSVLAEVGASSLGLGFAILFGTAPWLSLVAVICLWGAVVTGSIVVCSCCVGKDNLLGTSPSNSQEEAERDAEIEARAEQLAEEIVQEREEEAHERRWWKRRSRKQKQKQKHHEEGGEKKEQPETETS